MSECSQDWIKTEDEYPPNLTPVLGFHPLTLLNYAVCYRQEREEGNLWHWSGPSVHEDMTKHCKIPTHWMPLPEPPDAA